MPTRRARMTRLPRWPLHAILLFPAAEGQVAKTPSRPPGGRNAATRLAKKNLLPAARTAKLTGESNTEFVRFSALLRQRAQLFEAAFRARSCHSRAMGPAGRQGRWRGARGERGSGGNSHEELYPPRPERAAPRLRSRTWARG